MTIQKDQRGRIFYFGWFTAVIYLFTDMPWQVKVPTRRKKNYGGDTPVGNIYMVGTPLH